MRYIVPSRNYHNVPNYIVKPIKITTEEYFGLIGLVTARTLRRIQQHYCGMSDCTCGSGPEYMPATGNYPDTHYWIMIREDA